MSGEQLHAFDLCLCRHALDAVRGHLTDPEIAAYVADLLPAPVAAYLHALGDDEEPPPMLLGDRELDDLSFVFASGPFQLDQPWIPYAPLYRRGLDCVTEVREALSREHAERWAQASARFSKRLEGDRIYLSNGIEIVREWVGEARRLLRAMGRTDLLPAPEGTFPTPTCPTPVKSPPAAGRVNPSPDGPETAYPHPAPVIPHGVSGEAALAFLEGIDCKLGKLDALLRDKQHAPEPEWFSIDEVAVITGLSPDHVRRHVVAGTLPVCNQGTFEKPYYRVRRSDIDAWMSQRMQRPGPVARKSKAAPGSYRSRHHGTAGG